MDHETPRPALSRLSANLGFLWPDRPLPARIEAAAAAGFDAVEMHWPYDTPPETVAALCAARGLALVARSTPRPATGPAISGWRPCRGVRPSSPQALRRRWTGRGGRGRR